MGKTKSANRQATPRTEGIYAVTAHALGVGQSRHEVRCLLCDRLVNSSALTRSSHGRKHVREGTAVARREYTLYGPRTVFERVPATPPAE